MTNTQNYIKNVSILSQFNLNKSVKFPIYYNSMYFMSKRCFSTKMSSSAGLFSVPSSSRYSLKRLVLPLPHRMTLKCIAPPKGLVYVIWRAFREISPTSSSHLRLKKGFHESAPRGGFTSNVRRVKVRLLKGMKAAVSPYG